MLAQQKLYQILKKLQANHALRQYIYKCYCNRIFICLKVKKSFRMFLKRLGGDMWTINEGKIKKSFVVCGGGIFKDQFERKAKEILKFVFNTHIRMRV